MVCYASTASAGNAETDYTGQMQVTVVAPDLTSLSPDNAFANEVVAAIDVTLSTDAPNGGFIGFASISGTNCAGTCTPIAEVAIPACTPACAICIDLIRPAHCGHQICCCQQALRPANGPLLAAESPWGLA